MGAPGIGEELCNTDEPSNPGSGTDDGRALEGRFRHRKVARFAVHIACLPRWLEARRVGSGRSVLVFEAAADTTIARDSAADLLHMQRPDMRYSTFDCCQRWSTEDQRGNRGPEGPPEAERKQQRDAQPDCRLRPPGRAGGEKSCVANGRVGAFDKDVLAHGRSPQRRAKPACPRFLRICALKT